MICKNYLNNFSDLSLNECLIESFSEPFSIAEQPFTIAKALHSLAMSQRQDNDCSTFWYSLAAMVAQLPDFPGSLSTLPQLFQAIFVLERIHRLPEPVMLVGS